MSEEKIENAVAGQERPDVKTAASKLSTERLIGESPNGSVESRLKGEDDGGLLSLGLLQFCFGFCMVVFGGLVLHYDASLAQLAGGIWAGCLSMSTGIVGILASAREWCPLRSAPQKITHTIFLALSLVSLAIAQLVVALAATGAVRDFNSSEYNQQEEEVTTPSPSGKISITLPLNYMSILCNLGLLLVSTAEFTVAAVSSYKSSRILCPCFRRKQDYIDELNMQRNALVNSWLGKQSPPQVYVVATGTSTLGKGSKGSGGLPVPVFVSQRPRMLHYPLIPAPLGTIPSPVIPPSPRHAKKMVRKKKKSLPASKEGTRKKSKAKAITEQDVVRTYTGLDKMIAEEFIDICDSRNVSLSSDSSCTGSCQRGHPNSDVASNEYLVVSKP